jgi:molybdopterin-guanine dinucleotide biosynthesis protein A
MERSEERERPGERASAAPAPVWGGVLIGGAGRRMGAPKQLVRHDGATLAERAVAALAAHAEGVALLGAGAVPAALGALLRLADAALAGGIETGAVPAPPRLADAALAGGIEAGAKAAGGEWAASAAGGGAGGPLAGMLAAARWRPDAAWVFAPCDLPAIAPEAVAWLLGERRRGRWAVLPRTAPGAPVEPLFALYEPPAHRLLEELAAAPPAGRAPRRLAGHPRVAVVTVPPALAHCWAGANTPAELAALRRSGGGGAPAEESP